MKNIFQIIKTHWLAFTIVILVAISVLSLYPLDNLPDVPGSDKTHHFIAYGALAFPVALAKPKKWLFFILGFFCYSGAIELIQPFVNRYGEWLDLGANTLGLMLGVILAYLANQFLANQLT